MLTEKKIDEIFNKATHQAEIINELYKVAYPEWDMIREINGFPQISGDLNLYISAKAIEFDKKHHPGVLAGGAWMNKGFSGREHIKDGRIIRAPVKY